MGLSTVTTVWLINGSSYRVSVTVIVKTESSIQAPE